MGKCRVVKGKCKCGHRGTEESRVMQNAEQGFGRSRDEQDYRNILIILKSWESWSRQLINKKPDFSAWLLFNFPNH